MPDSEREGFPDVPTGTVTFLFTDIEGSTRLLEQLRDGYAAVLSDQRDLLRAAFANCSGHEIDTQGDAFFVAFPRAVDALNCVIEAQQALSKHAWPAGAVVRVRMGLHTGEPLLGRTGYVGMDVHRAARIAAAGHGGQVLLSQTTRDLIYQDLPPGASLRALGEFKLKDIRFAQPLYQLDIAGLPTDFAPLKTLASDEEPPAPGEPPFKGLQYFDEADAEWFFGREGVTGRLAARACAERFLAVVGASGSGKSSLVRAGLVPALKRGGRLREGGDSLCPDVAWQIFVLTPTAHPLEALAISLSRAGNSLTTTATLIDDLRADPRSLHLHVQRLLRQDQRGARAAGQERVLLVVDQFEELFTLCRDPAERQAFVDNLLTAAGADGGGTSVVLTLRADFYEHLAAYLALSAAVAQHQEYLGAMNAAELRQAIEAPAARGGWEFSPGLVDLLLHEIGASEGRAPEPGALPLLSHALLETWKHRRSNVMTLRAYGLSGGVRGAIAHTAEGVFQDELTPAQQAIARNIFLRLTELGEGTQDTRRRVTYSELFPEAQGADVEEVLSRLADARLITTSEGTVEVAHEALIREWPTLRQWLDDDREGLRLHRHLTEVAQSWAAFNRDNSELYRGTRLGQASDWAAAHPGQLNALEQEFLHASQAQTERDETEREATRERELQAVRHLAEAHQQRAETQARAARQLRRRAVYLLGALVVALAAALTAIVFGQRANISALQANQNLSTAQAAQATSQSETDARATQQNLAVVSGQHANESAALANQSLSTAQAAQATSQSETNARATQQSVAEANFKRAEAQRLAAEANNLLHVGGNSELIALLAIRSMNLEYSAQGDAAVQTAATLDYPLARFDTGGLNVFRMIMSPSRENLLTESTSVTVDHGAILQLWNAQTHAIIQTIPVPTDFGNVGFTPDGQSIFINDHTDTDNTGHSQAEFWDIQRRQITQSFKIPNCSADPVWLNNQTFILGCDDGSLWRVDMSTGQEQSIALTTSNVQSISPHMKFAMISPDNLNASAQLWNLAAATATLTINNSTGIGSVAFSPDDSQIVAGFGDGSIRMWRTDTGQQIGSFDGHTNNIESLFLSPDGQYLLSGSIDRTVRLWDVQTRHELRRLTFGSFPVAGNFSSDSQTLLTGGTGGVARLWTVTPRPEWPVLIGHTAYSVGTTFSPDGQTLAAGGNDNTIRLWNVHTGQTLHVFPVDGFVNYGLRFPPNGTQLLAGTHPGSVYLWDVATGAQLWQIRPSGLFVVNDVAFSPDGRLFAAVGRTRTAPSGTYALIGEALTGTIIQTITVPTGTDKAYGVEFSPDGRSIVVAAEDSIAYLIDIQTGQVIQTFPGHTGGLNQAHFSPDGRYLVTASLDNTARLWDVQTGKALRKFAGQSSSIWNALFSLDGTLLATGSGDGTLRLWDTATGHELRQYTADPQAVEYLAWSPDGKLLASSGDDMTTKLWDVDYHTTIAYLCGRLQHDLTDAERAQYNITDTTPTCGK